MGVCEHYHRCEEGEVCGHWAAAAAATPSTEMVPAPQVGSAFPSEILEVFLYLGSYDNASWGELLKTQAISLILNARPATSLMFHYVLKQ